MSTFHSAVVRISCASHIVFEACCIRHSSEARPSINGTRMPQCSGCTHRWMCDDDDARVICKQCPICKCSGCTHRWMCDDVDARVICKQCPRCMCLSQGLCAEPSWMCTHPDFMQVCNDCQACTGEVEFGASSSIFDTYPGNPRCNERIKQYQRATCNVQEGFKRCKKVQRVGADGNCFYYSLASLFESCPTGHCPDQARELRLRISNYFLEDPGARLRHFDPIHRCNQKKGWGQRWVCLRRAALNYIEEQVLKDGAYAAEPEIEAAANIFDIHIEQVTIGYGLRGYSEESNPVMHFNREAGEAFTIVFCGHHYMPAIWAWVEE